MSLMNATIHQALFYDEEDTENYKPVSLTLVLGKVMEHITGQVHDNQVIKPNQNGFMKGKSCLNKLISFTTR